MLSVGHNRPSTRTREVSDIQPRALPTTNNTTQIKNRIPDTTRERGGDQRSNKIQKRLWSGAYWVMLKIPRVHGYEAAWRLLGKIFIHQSLFVLCFVFQVLYKELHFAVLSFFSEIFWMECD